MNDVEQIKALDIVEIIDSLYPLRKMGKSWKACCPFHNDVTPSFVVSKDKSLFHCFGCGAGGTVIDFWMQYYSMTFSEAVNDICRRYDIEKDKAPVNYISKAKRDQLAEDRMILAIAQYDSDMGRKVTYKDKQRIKLARERIKNNTQNL